MSEKNTTVKFNPLAFTPEEVNEMLRIGYEPAPLSMWYLTDERRQQQIDAGERQEPRYRCPTCGVGMSRKAFGCGPSGCNNVPC